jgi:hypothetical protein
MGQDMAKGRRTEIEYLNGFVVREGEQVGIQARANERLVEIVKKVERGELRQDPAPHHRAPPELSTRFRGTAARRGLGEIQRKTCFSPQTSHSSAVQCVLFQQLMRQIRCFADQPNFAPDQRI